ncbi:hypothetical protein CMI47_19685 [Candidatus Pacearchaeota archaeon]|nr:hypothetical protein [Candidatus Pacearchaeota archaeon]
MFYCMHRFIFHGKLGRLPILKRIRKIHTTHHAKPDDLEKAFFPNWAKMMIAATMIAVGFISLPLAIGVCSFFPVYAYRHWTAHNGSNMPWAIHHMNHHLVNPNKNFGGIYPVIDVIFRTNEAIK